MIRWKYLIPRLVLVGVLVGLVWFGLNPLVRWAIVSSGQKAVSAKVEIGEVKTSLFQGELCLSDVRVANPRSVDENLFEASQIALQLDTNSLLRRKFIVREGRISGLRIGTARATSGALDPSADWDVRLPKLGLETAAGEWLDQLAELLQEELIRQAEELDSVRLAKELIERWPAEYEQLEARADKLKWRIGNLRELSKLGGKDAARLLNAYQQAASELQAVQREIADLQGEIDRLGDQVFRDKDALVAAKDRDLEQIRDTLRLENLRAENLTEYLLGPELRRTVVTLAKWIQWGRQHFGSEVDQPEPLRGRGVDVLFAGIKQRPDWLVESLVLDGRGQAGGHEFQFLAAASGITSQPRVYGKPTVLRAQIETETLVQIEAVLDHTGETPSDRITVNCPDWKQPERVLGRPGQLALRVSPGSTHLWASLELRGGELSGQVLIRQEPVELVPELAPRYGGERLAASLGEAMEELREIRVMVDLSGTFEEPDWRLRSNLGPQVVASLEGWLDRELESRRDELLARARQRAEEEIARFEEIVVAKQQEIFKRMELDGREVRELNQAIARRIRLPGGVLEQGLPGGLPLRF